VPASAILGPYNVLVQNAAGLSNPVPFTVVAFQGLVLRDNLDENGASIWMRRGSRAE
jgi:hypothetical protein